MMEWWNQVAAKSKAEADYLSAARMLDDKFEQFLAGWLSAFYPDATPEELKTHAINFTDDYLDYLFTKIEHRL